MTRRGRHRLMLFLALTLISVLAGPMFVWLAFERGSVPLGRHAIDGGIGGALLWGGWLFLWPSRRFSAIRRRSFPLRLVILCASAMLVTAATAILANFRITGTFSLEVATSVELHAYVLVVTLGVLVVLQIVRMIGSRAIANVLLGRYHNPVEEERIFLFVDLKDSTALARRLGDLGVQKLISRFVFDVTAPILEFGGEIHAYVGDLVIVTWPLEKGARDGACLRCFFAIQDCLSERSEEYLATFQTVPGVRAGLHGGPIVVSEIGDVKTAVVYFGDTVNTAARLEDAAKRHQTDIVTSAALLSRMSLPEGLEARKLGAETLRGRDEPTELVAISRTEPARQ